MEKEGKIAICYLYILAKNQSMQASVSSEIMGLTPALRYYGKEVSQYSVQNSGVSLHRSRRYTNLN